MDYGDSFRVHIHADHCGLLCRERDHERDGGAEDSERVIFELPGMYDRLFRFQFPEGQLDFNEH